MKTLLSLCRVFGLLVSLFSATLPLAHGGFIVTGVNEGAAPQVKLFNMPGQTTERSFFAYAQNFLGGVRVALGDVDGDGEPDIITGAGPGGFPHVKVFSGATGAEIRSFFAYNEAFTGGVFVAAGDVNGDGQADIITGSGAGVSTEVKVFNGTNSTVLTSFFPYGPAFSGGVLVAGGDVNSDGFADIITGAGSTTPHVKVFHGRTRTEIMSFLAYNPEFNGGVFVAAGDLDGDGNVDIVTGAGPGGGPQVKVFRARTGDLIRSFLAYEANFIGGVRVAVGDVNNDGRVEVITAPAFGRSPQVRAFNGRTGAQVTSFFAYNQTFTGGVFVGGGAELPIRAITDPATNVTVSSATLHGTVDANDRTVDVKFQYGPTATYGKSVPATPAQVSGTDPTEVSANVVGLQPSKTYHYRVVVTDGIGGTVFGQDRVFVTSANKAPSGGTFTVTPASPVPAGTVLTATFTDWIDEDGHTPLRYEVREGTTVIATISEDATPTFILSPGTHVLTGRVYDTIGAFTETVDVEVVVEGDPESEVLAASRENVPGAGTGGIPEEARWTGFGVPAIADGSVKYIANFNSPTERGGGIFSNDTPVVLIGDPVPGAGAGGEFAIPSGAVFKKFKDPVTDAAGHVAFIATMGGAGVASANDTVVVSNGRTGTLEVIAREGSAAPGAEGANFSAFLGVSVDGVPGGTIFTARLKGAVRPTNDQGAWWLPAGSMSTMLMLREGSEGVSQENTVKSFALLQTWPGTAGHGRGQIDGDEALLRIVLSSGGNMLAFATPGAVDVFEVTGQAIFPGYVWKRMAQPSSDDTGQFLSVRGSYVDEFARGTPPVFTGVFQSTDGGGGWTVVAQVGQQASGTDADWIDVGHPVQSATSADLAFLGKVKGGTVKPTNDTGIWWKSGAGGLRLLAQEGTQAVGCAAGEKFSSFKSLALPGGSTGPLFVAKLVGGTVNTRNDSGVWTVDTSGSLRLLFREGQRIGTKKVLSFTVLSEVSGSPGVTRAFNNNGQVAWRATFTDGTTGIVVTDIP